MRFGYDAFALMILSFTLILSVPTFATISDDIGKPLNLGGEPSILDRFVDVYPYDGSNWAANGTLVNLNDGGGDLQVESGTSGYYLSDVEAKSGFLIDLIRFEASTTSLSGTEEINITFQALDTDNNLLKEESFVIQNSSNNFESVAFDNITFSRYRFNATFENAGNQKLEEVIVRGDAYEEGINQEDEVDVPAFHKNFEFMFMFLILGLILILPFGWLAAGRDNLF